MTAASQWPKGFILDENKKNYAIRNGVDPAKVDDFWEDFHDWCLSKGAAYKDWDAAFRMRVRKAKNWGLFQGRAPVIKHSIQSDQRKIHKAYNALVYNRGKNINEIQKRLGLTDYEKECVLMAYNGGPQKVEKLSKRLFKKINQQGGLS